MARTFVMRLKEKIRRLLGKKYNFEDEAILKEARERAEVIKQLKFQQRLLEHQRDIKKEQFKMMQIEEQISFYNGEEEQPKNGDLTTLITGILVPILLKKFAPDVDLSGIFNPQSQKALPLPDALPKQNLSDKTELSDEEIQEQLNQIPRKQLKMVKGMPDVIIKAYAQKNLNFSESTIDRAIQILKNR